MNQHKKFLFDLNNFDTDEVEEEIIEEIEEEPEDLPPPPPTFSEEELEAAKMMAHETGHQAGMAEERQNREQKTQDILNKIAENFSTIFAAEVYREKQYEEESLHLALSVIDHLSPTLRKYLGKDTLTEIISQTVKLQSGQSEIRIEVADDIVNDVKSALETIWPDKDDAPRYKIMGSNSLNEGACNIIWQDGGMVRDPQMTAIQITELIKSLLEKDAMAKKAVKELEIQEEIDKNSNSMLTNDQNNGIKEEATHKNGDDDER